MSRRTCDECAACDECIGHRTYMYRSGPQNQTSATRHDPDRTHAWPGTQRTERHRGGPICDMVKLEGPMYSIYLNIFGACSGPCAACMWWWGHRAELVAGRRSTSARGTTSTRPTAATSTPQRISLVLIAFASIRLYNAQHVCSIPRSGTRTAQAPLKSLRLTFKFVL